MRGRRRRLSNPGWLPAPGIGTRADPQLIVGERRRLGLVATLPGAASEPGLRPRDVFEHLGEGVDGLLMASQVVESQRAGGQ